MKKESSDELTSSIERMGVVLTKRLDDIKISVMLKLEDEKYAYETSFKVSKDLLDPEKPTLEEFFRAAQSAMTDVLAGKKELKAIV